MSRPHILVADKTGYWTRMLGERLPAEQFDLTLTSNALAVAKAFTDQAPSALICEYELDELAAPQLFQLLQSNAVFAVTPLIVYTHHPYEHWQEALTDIHHATWLHKHEHDIDSLVEVVYKRLNI